MSGNQNKSQDTSVNSQSADERGEVPEACLPDNGAVDERSLKLDVVKPTVCRPSDSGIRPPGYLTEQIGNATVTRKATFHEIIAPPGTVKLSPSSNVKDSAVSEVNIVVLQATQEIITSKLSENSSGLPTEFTATVKGVAHPFEDGSIHFTIVGLNEEPMILRVAGSIFDKKVSIPPPGAGDTSITAAIKRLDSNEPFKALVGSPPIVASPIDTLPHNVWATISSSGSPVARTDHAAVWTGTQMLAFGGRRAGGDDMWEKTGATYDPATNKWTSMGGDALAPTLSFPQAVMADSKAVVLGVGSVTGLNGTLIDAYDTSSNSWKNVTLINDTAAVLTGISMIQTGDQLLLWGGFAGAPLNSSLREGKLLTYKNIIVSNDPPFQMAPISEVEAPKARFNHSAVWTGREMIIFGGMGFNTYLKSGEAGVWTPNGAQGTWRSLSLPSESIQPPVYKNIAVWTGSKMLVWGGTIASSDTPSGAGSIYDPATDQWTAMSNVDAPSARKEVRGVWSGKYLIIIGAAKKGVDPVVDAYYDPSINKWTRISQINAPLNRSGHTIVWTGNAALIWGGQLDDGTTTNSGAMFYP